MKFTPQQKEFFDVFGFLHFPGLLKDSVGWILEEFETVFKLHSIFHEETKRTMCPVTFVDQTTKFCTLLDDPRICSIAAGVMGPDFQYEGGDGNFYSGDSQWHSDTIQEIGFYKHVLHVKFAFYLEPLTRSTGAIRVIPGSHLPKDRFTEGLAHCIYEGGLPGHEIPALAVETNPGDLIIFNHNLKHASFGGGKRRRMFTMNMCANPVTPEERAEVRKEFEFYGGSGAEKMHSEIMMRIASPERLKHLEPIRQFEEGMAAVARAKKAAKAATLQPA